MRLRLINFLLRALSLIPLSVAHMLGAGLGLLAWWLPTTLKRNTLINLKLCYPDQSGQWINTTARASLQETGKALSELGWFWCKPRRTLEQKISAVHGQQHLDDAIATGRGVILVSPHLGAWEFCPLVMAPLDSAVFMYRLPRQAALDPVFQRARTRFGAELAPLTPGGIKKVFTALRSGGTVGILPDQEPDEGSGEFAPLFGTPAYTMTLLSGLARKSNATVLYVAFIRLPHGQGYDIHYVPADPDLANADTSVATTALNRQIENCINIAPTQYLWSYKRHRLMPDGSRRRYHR